MEFLQRKWEKKQGNIVQYETVYFYDAATLQITAVEQQAIFLIAGKTPYYFLTWTYCIIPKLIVRSGWFSPVFTVVCKTLDFCFLLTLMFRCTCYTIMIKPLEVTDSGICDSPGVWQRVLHNITEFFSTARYFSTNFPTARRRKFRGRYWQNRDTIWDL